ncbi:MAG: hypothetical protein Q7J84_16160 [Sulfuricaulis sp.]|nr:hypothetical protein [Sulfuricaulis sp.]
MGAIGKVLIFLGPFIGGVIVTVFDLSPNPRLARNMESAGNIFVLIFSIYIGVKVYKNIIRKYSKEESSVEYGRKA